MTKPVLKFQVEKRYEGFLLECEASFESVITAVFGRSGSGKTTLLNCIGGLVSPDSGSIEIRAEMVYSSGPRVRVAPEKRRCGYVLQDAALFPHMSVWQNINYGYRLTPVDLRTIEPEHLLELLDLTDLVDRGIEGLSGGERQRVALARALATSPRLLLLDEPLASLDMAFRGVILRYLKEIWAELGTPMVYVSHSISEVMALAQDTLVLSGGRVVAQGPPTDVLVRSDVGVLADYAHLQNLLEAEVISPADDEGMAHIKIGDATLTTPDVRAGAGETVMVSLGAGEIILALEVPSKMSAQNAIPARVEAIHVADSRVLVYADVGARVVVEITPGALRDLELREGQEVYLIVKSMSIIALEGVSGL